ncbi:hypothetical protein K1719_011201 [Acacia pycnantha]|nr:hypothetical protein K1719_011201 [Acacia pycnantha]
MKKPALIIVGVPLFIHRRLLMKKEYLGQQSCIFPGHLENVVGNDKSLRTRHCEDKRMRYPSTSLCSF